MATQLLESVREDSLSGDPADDGDVGSEEDHGDGGDDNW